MVLIFQNLDHFKPGPNQLKFSVKGKFGECFLFGTDHMMKRIYPPILSKLDYLLKVSTQTPGQISNTVSSKVGRVYSRKISASNRKMSILGLWAPLMQNFMMCSKITFFLGFGTSWRCREYFKITKLYYFTPTDRALAALACLTKIPGDRSLACLGLQ